MESNEQLNINCDFQNHENDNIQLYKEEEIEKLKQQKKLIDYEELTEEQLNNITTKRTR